LFFGLLACSTPAVSPAAGVGGRGDSTGGSGGRGGASGTASDAGLVLPEGRLLRLELTPDNDVLEVDRGQSGTRAFTVTLVRAGGASEDVTGKAKLTSDNPQAGTLAGGVFHSAVMDANGVAFTRIDALYEEGGESVRTRANLTVVWLRTSGDSQDFFFTLP